MKLSDYQEYFRYGGSKTKYANEKDVASLWLAYIKYQLYLNKKWGDGKSPFVDKKIFEEYSNEYNS